MWVSIGLQVRFMKSGNVYRVDLQSQVHNLSLVIRIIKHNYVLALLRNIT